MRAILICLLALAGCRGILDIPSEGKVGCPAPCRVTVSGRAVHAESLEAPQPACHDAADKVSPIARKFRE